MTLRDGPSDPVPDGWRQGTRTVGPSSRNRAKISNHVFSLLKWAEYMRSLSRDGDEVERNLDEIRRALRMIRRHQRRGSVRIKVELELDVNWMEWR